MPKISLIPGATSKLQRIFVQDSSKTDGSGLAGLAFGTASLSAFYIREGAATSVEITLVTMTVGTWVSSGFKEVDAINLPGVYEIGLPNAAIAAGAESVLIMLKGAADMAPVPLEIQLSIDANVVQISGDSVAADNMEATYDGTGYANDFAPSTQAQLGNIAIASSALNIPAESGTNVVGNVTGGDYESTHFEDGVLHVIEDTAGALDQPYVFSIGGSGQPTSMNFHHALKGNNDDLLIQLYDYDAAGWDTGATLVGTNAGALETQSIVLYDQHVGKIGADAGKVKIRYYAASGLTSAELSVEHLYLTYSKVRSTVGYSNEAIHIDTNGSNTNTEVDVDGVGDNPVSTWAAALTLNATLGLDKFIFRNGSSITLTGNSDHYTLEGTHWDLALGGQSIDGIAVSGAHTVGIGTGSAGDPSHFEHCSFGAVTLPPFQVTQCGFGENSGQMTAGSTGEFVFDRCFSLAPGVALPALVFTGLGPSSAIHNRGWLGGSNYTLDADCTLSHEVLAGGGTVVTTGGADVEIRGISRSLTLAMSAAETVQFVGTTGPIILNGTTTGTVNLYGVSASVTDNTSAAVVTDKTVSQENVGDAVWDETLSGHNIAGSAGKLMRELTDTIVTSDTAQGPGTNGNSIVLSSGASSVDGTYDPGIILIASGTGAGQSRRILEYVGSTRECCVNRDWKVAPDNTSVYVIFADAGGLHVNEGRTQAGGASTATLNTLASSVNDFYNHQAIFLVSGTGQDQVREITDYNGTTKVATVTPAWDTQPDNSTGYIMIPHAEHNMNDISVADIFAGVVDGSISLQTVLSRLNAFARGDTTIVDNGNGTVTITFKDEAGAGLFSVTASQTDGDR